MGIDVRDPDQPVGTLSGGERQAMAIARAVYFGARVLILDEPTSALGVKQSGIVLRYVVQARERGVGVIFITHNPHHAYPVGNRFTAAQPRAADGRLREGRGRPRRARAHDGRRRGAGAADARAGAGLSSLRRGASWSDAPGDGVGIGVIGFGWMGQAHSRCCRRLPSYSSTATTSPTGRLSATPSRRAGATRCDRSASPRRCEDWRQVVEHADVRRRVRHRAQHAARRDGRGGRGGRQARVLREAGRRHARRRRSPPSGPPGAPA